MLLDDKLSPHFTLRELIRTNHREIDNTPSEEVIERLAVFCKVYLEPVRKQFGALYVTSGYRSPALNKAIKGAKDSAHPYGCASDFNPLVKGTKNSQVIIWLRDKSGLDFDQVIEEETTTDKWIHLG